MNTSTGTPRALTAQHIVAGAAPGAGGDEVPAVPRPDTGRGLCAAGGGAFALDQVGPRRFEVSSRT